MLSKTPLQLLTKICSKIQFITSMDIEKHAIGLGLLWLVTTSVFFLLGWVTPVLAVSLSAGLIFCSIRIWVKIPFSSPPPKYLCFHLIPIGALAFFCSFYSGLTGHFPQHILDMAQRNAVYGNLCQGDWPIVLPDGRYFVYYFSSFLPAAFFSKITGYDFAPFILMLWNFLAIFLAFTLVLYRTQKTSIVWTGIIMLLFLHDPVGLLKPFSGIIEALAGCNISLTSQLSPLLAGFQTTINHTPGILLATALLFNQRISYSALPIIGVTTLLMTVFGAISLFPFLIYRYLKLNACSSLIKTAINATRTFIFSLEGFCSICLFGITVIFHKCANSEIVITPMFFVTHNKPILYIIFKNIAHTALIVGSMMCPLLWCRKQLKGLFWILFWSYIFVNFIYIGNGGPNELAFKGNTALVIITAFGWMHTLNRGPIFYKSLVWILLAILTVHHSYTGLVPRLMTFGRQEKNINNPFCGHLYHPGSLLDQSVPKSTAPPIPHILYTEAGASRNIFPFSWLPPARDDLYSAPANYRADNRFLRIKPDNKNLHILFYDKK